MEKLEQAIELGTRIKELRAEIEEKEAEVADYERRLAALLSRTRERKQVPVASNGHGTIDDRIWHTLNNSTYLMGAKELKGKMPDLNIGSIRTALARMAKTGRVTRRERGQYEEAHPDTTSVVIAHGKEEGSVNSFKGKTVESF